MAIDQGQRARGYVGSLTQPGRQEQRYAIDDAEEQLRQAAQGDTSVAQHQLRQAASQAQRGIAAQAASQGANPLAMRSAGYAGAQMQGQVGMQAAELRAQEMQAAQQALAQQRQMYAQGNLQQAGMTTQLYDSGMEREQQQSQFDRQMRAQRDQAIAGGIMGGVQMAAGIGGMLSDEDKKRKVDERDDQAIAMLRALSPATYEYDEDVPMPAGRYAGIMAQDLERSPMGATMVRETPMGRMVDTQQAAMAALGAAAAVQRQLDELRRHAAKGED